VFFKYFIYPLSFLDKRGEYLLFIFGSRLYFKNRSIDFCPRMAKWGVC